MLYSHIGEIAALITAICWTITAAFFEIAGKRIGSLSLNIIRLVMAFLLLGFYTLFTRGLFLPLDASSNAWIYLLISGIIGLVIGDMFLFEAYVEIGSRISLLIMSCVPPITAISGYIIMGEKIAPLHILGMLITVSGIGIVILVKDSKEDRVKFAHPLKGVTFAFIGALGQAFGMIFSKLGMGNYNPFAATQIRVIAGIVGFSVILTFTKHWTKLFHDLRDVKSMTFTTIGAFFGPFIGVSLTLLAMQYTTAGIVSTITSISPILIIPFSITVFKEKVSLKEICGAVISIIGVSLLFM